MTEPIVSKEELKKVAMIFMAAVVSNAIDRAYEQTYGACETEKSQAEKAGQTFSKPKVSRSQEAPKQEVIGITGSSTIYRKKVGK